MQVRRIGLSGESAEPKHLICAFVAAAARYAAGHVVYPNVGAAYDKAMQTLVFDPLGDEGNDIRLCKGREDEHVAPHAQDIMAGRQRH